YIVGCKNIVDVPPGLDKLAWLIAVGSFGPGRPVAIHLRRQAQEQWMIPSSGISGPASDIAIEFPLDDVFEAIIGLIGELRLWLPGLPGDHRDRAMCTHRIHPGAVEILRPVCGSPGLIEGQNGHLLTGNLFEMVGAGSWSARSSGRERPVSTLL